MGKMIRTEGPSVTRHSMEDPTRGLQQIDESHAGGAAADQQEAGPDETNGMDILESLPELQDKPDGHKCRVEVIVEKTADGINIVDANYVAPVGGKSRQEYVQMGPEERQKYDEESVLGTPDA